MWYPKWKGRMLRHKINIKQCDWSEKARDLTNYPMTSLRQQVPSRDKQVRSVPSPSCVAKSVQQRNCSKRKTQYYILLFKNRVIFSRLFWSVSIMNK